MNAMLLLVYVDITTVSIRIAHRDHNYSDGPHDAENEWI